MVGGRGIRIGRPGLRRAFRIFVAAFAIVALVLVASFFLPATRSAWLGAGLDFAARSLPGRLHGEWSWSRLGRFEGHDIIWTAPAIDSAAIDTLAVIEHLGFEVDLRALLRHDLIIDGLDGKASRLDVPRIMVHLPPARTSANGVVSDTVKSIPYFRAGSVPSFPSAEIRSLRLAVGRLMLPSSATVTDLKVEASASILAGESPRLVVHDGSARTAANAVTPWRLDLTSLRAVASYDPSARTVTLDSLVAAVASLEVATDTLSFRAHPLDLRARGSWSDRDKSGDLDADVRFHLEVPVALSQPVPNFEVRELSGRIGLQARGTLTALQMDATLDLDPAADVRRGHARGFLAADLQPEPRLRQVRLDSLDLQWRQTTLEAAGFWDGSTVDGRIVADLQDLELAAMLAPAMMDGITGRAQLEGTVAGAANDPRIGGRLFASGDIASVWKLPGAAEAAANLPPGFPREDFAHIAPDLNARFEGTLSNLRVELRADLGRTPWLERCLLAGHALVAPRAAALGHVRLDTLSVALRGAELLASGDVDTLRADLAVELVMHGTALLDLLAPQALPGADLDLAAAAHLAGPWRDLGVDANLKGRIAAAEFAAQDIRASVVGSRDAMRATARAAGAVRMGSIVLDSAAAVWSGSVVADGGLPAGDFSLEAWAPEAAGRLHGSTAGDGRRTATIDSLVFAAAGQVMRATAPIILEMGPGPRDFSVSGLRLRGDLGTLDVDGRMAGHEMTLGAVTDLMLTREWLDALFPSPFWSAGDGLDVAVQGAVNLATTGPGTGGEAALAGHSALRLIPRNQEPEAVLAVDFRLAHGDTAGLTGSLSFGMDGTDLARGSLFWPGALDRTTGRWVAAPGARGGVDIPEQALPLAFINRFLPPEVSLEGQVLVAAGVAVDAPASGSGTAARPDSAATPVDEGSVNGRARTDALRINLPNRSRVDVTAEVGLAGRPIDPRVTGTVTVTDGLFRLPEAQRTLLPTSGESALWAATGEAAADSAAGDAVSALYVPDLDLQVVIPGNFKVIGYGLEIELAGDFRVSRGADEKGRHAPVMRGDVRVVDGTLNAMNRLFTVERGEFTLEGRIPVDPTVDLVMAADIDGTTVRILVTGTALQPKIELRSDPEMIQADIMAFVLFGRPFNELDTDQTGSLSGEQTPAQQLRRNLEGLALVFGAAGVQNRVSGSIGVDQVQIGSDTAGGSTLVLGKFINPRLLLKYHQSLERSGSYFMTLEYTLSRLFKLVSTYGQSEEATGLELRWQQRY